MKEILERMRYLAMSEFILHGSVAAGRIYREERWSTGAFSLTGTAAKAFFWLLMGESVLFVANWIVVPLMRKIESLKR